MSGEKTSIRVLLVERYSTRAGDTGSLLARSPNTQFTVAKATSMPAALEQLTKNGTDIVLYDLDLSDSPVLDGLRTLRSGFPDTPVIVLAPLEHKQVARVALDMGANDCVVKDQIDSRLLEQIIVRNARKRSSQ